MPTVQGVLVYTCIQQPTFKYQDKVNKEYKVSVVVDEDIADTWNENFPKQSAKVVKTSDFQKEYKIDPPFEGEKKQYVITLKKDAQYRDGNPIPENNKPKVYLNTGTDANGKVLMKDVTADKLVGNGSVGAVSYETTSNDYGVFARLKNVRVDSLVEYIQKGSGDADLGVTAQQDDSDFDDAPVTASKKKEVQAKEDSPRPNRGKADSAKNVQDSDSGPF